MNYSSGRQSVNWQLGVSVGYFELIESTTVEDFILLNYKNECL